MSLIIMLINRILGIKCFNNEQLDSPYEKHENRMGTPK